MAALTCLSPPWPITTVLLQVLCEALALVRCLWVSLRRYLKMQFEVIFKSVFLRLLFQVSARVTPRLALAEQANRTWAPMLSDRAMQQPFGL